MRKTILALATVLFCSNLLAQAPQLMSYQAVVRNGNNQLLSNAPVGMRISVLQGSANGNAVYSETQSVTTNAQGLATLSIGGGTPQIGTFAGINWANGPYFLKAETDPAGGTNYSITATSQLLSVPYALYAEKANIASNASKIQIEAISNIPPNLANGELKIYNCNGVAKFTPCSPILTTNVTTSISGYSAVSGGNISTDAGSHIIGRGVCWSTNPNPTVNDSKTSDGSGIGAFASQVKGLVANTLYYIRAYAITNTETAYGNQMIFTTSNAITDIDGNVYTSVVIGTQEWMVENLRTSKFRNGDGISFSDSGNNWMSTNPMYCYQGNAPIYNVPYGKLYTWYTVFDSRGLCPIGWHVPSSAEWDVLSNFLGGSAISGGKLKAVTNWSLPNSGATNSSGFSALPGGYRRGDSLSDTALYVDFFLKGHWWTSTYFTSTQAFVRRLSYDSEMLSDAYMDMRSGLSVRCIKD